MSNEERFEMTSNIDIDLKAIPHPKGCYPVPVGATIPPRTPCWVVWKHGLIEWVPDGYSGETIIGSNASLHLTLYPIPAGPTPDDSPITFEYRRPDSSCLVVATWSDESRSWVFVDRAGNPISHSGNMITDWSPAIITKSGRGVWDERDKRDRVNEDGDRVEWLPVTEKWVVRAFGGKSFGSLAAIHKYCGEDYLTGFWDEEN